MPVSEWRQTARADLLTMVDYISDNNPDAAQQLKVEKRHRGQGGKAGGTS